MREGPGGAKNFKLTHYLAKAASVALRQCACVSVLLADEILDYRRKETMTVTPLLTSMITAERLQLAAAGSWTAAHSHVLEQLVDAAAPQAASAKRISIDMAGVQELDTLGAWLLERLLRGSNRSGPEAQFIGLPPHYRGLIDEMHRVNLGKRTPPINPNRIWAAVD